MRQKAQDIKTEYDTKKAQYDTVQAGLESNRSKLEQVCSTVKTVNFITLLTM